MPPISVLIKPASGMCNMSCAYCFYCDEMEKRSTGSYGFMTEQTLKNVIRKTMLRAEGSVTYAFQGGEPALRGLEFFEKAVALERQYNKNGILVNNVFQTNGYLIDADWCRFFKENHFLVGVSVDGTKELHDSLRRTGSGESTFEQVEKAISLLGEYGVEYNILTVVTNKTAENIDKIYSFYKEKGWRYQQYIACLDPLNEPHGGTEYGLTPQQYGNFLIRLFQLWYEDWQRGAPPYIRQFENYLGILLGYQPEACDQSGICGIQNVVEADGSVYPCDFYVLDEYRLGNFNENRMEEIHAAGIESGFMERSMGLAQECRECGYFKICRGGCQRNRDYRQSTGDYLNYFCKSYRMFFDECMERLSEIAESIKRR